MNPRTELTAAELRKVRSQEDGPGLTAARTRRRVIGYERDKMEHDDEREVRIERL